MDFGGVDWSNTERSYNLGIRKTNKPGTVKQDAAEAVREWDRLALIMNRHEKPAERHDFFRLKMRAQRHRDGMSLQTAASWLFDVTSEFGWGVGRAFSWWAGHMLAGAIALACAVTASGEEVDAWSAAWSSLLVSFSNSLAFLRLGSDDGYLSGPQEFLLGSVGGLEWLFVTVGTIQAVFGPILLFLLLLTMRNRFRLG